jgi:hypothetical protein
MPKVLEVAIAWLVVGLIVLSAVSGFGIVNTLVSLQYETNGPGECISQVTGYNLCQQLQLSQHVCAGSLLIAFLITLGAWLRRDK